MGGHKGCLKMLSVVWELCGYIRFTGVLELTSQPAGRVTGTLMAA